MTSVIMSDPTDLNLDAPSDLQDIPDMAIQLLPPPEGTYPDKYVLSLSLRAKRGLAYRVKSVTSRCGSSPWQKSWV